MAHKLHIEPRHIEEAIARGSGHGGQKINKTSNCVRLHHTITGIEVRVQKYREQHKNRIAAYTLLIQKVAEWAAGVESALAERDYKLSKQKQRRTGRSKEKMLEEKKQRQKIKQNRRPMI